MTLPGYRTRIEAPPEPRGLGVTALTLGAAGLLTFWMCGLGMLLAVAGLAIGVYAVYRSEGKPLAYAGIALSLLALLAAGGALYWFGQQAVDCGRYPAQIERTHCMETKFPLLKAHMD